MRPLIAATAALALAAFVLPGCQTVYDGHLTQETFIAGTSLRSIVLLPMDNATSDPAAGRALREFIASALAERGLRFRQTEESLLIAAKKTAPTESGLYPELGRLTGARYFITGTVHEYRYMSDLEGSPAVGFTLRLVDARDGRTLWTGTAANTGYGWQSISELCADSARKIAGRVPVAMRDETEKPRVCLRTGKPAFYTPTGLPDRYEVDTADGTLAYTVELKKEQLPPPYAPPAPAQTQYAPQQPQAQPTVIVAPVAAPQPVYPAATPVYTVPAAAPVHTAPAAQPAPTAPAQPAPAETPAAPGERQLR